MTPENRPGGALATRPAPDCSVGSENGLWSHSGATTVDFWPHPFLDEGRRTVLCPPGWSLAQIMVDELPPWQAAVACVNGATVSREAWDDLVLNPADIVQVRVVPQRDAFRALLGVLVVVGASLLGPVIAGALGVASAAGVAFITAGLGIVGMLLLNVLFPPRLPEVAGGAKFEQQYTLTGGANRLRPHEPLQLLFGMHRMFPDLVSREYVEFGSDNEQYLNQLFDFGIGENLARTNYRIGETPIGNYSEVMSQETIDADGHITLVAENVDTIAGGEFARNMLTVTRRTAVDVVGLGFDLSAQVFRVNNEGKVRGRSATFSLQYRRVGDAAWTVTPSVVLTTPDGGEGRNEVQRRTVNIAPAGSFDDTDRFDVRCIVTHIGSEDLSTLAGLDAGWAEDDDRLTVRMGVSFKAYGGARADFSGRNPYALRIRASGQLSGRIQELNCDGSQQIPSWNGSSWVPNTETSNPGDILLQWYRGWRIDGNTVAGYGLPDSLIDIEKIQGFAEHCTAMNLECNMVLQDERDEDAVAALIAQCGWGRIDSAGGRYSVIWEEANRPVTAVITPDNIILGSMQVLSDAENLADSFVGVFRDRESGYVENQVERPVDIANPTREFPLEVNLEGVTSGEAAALEINRAAAANFFHWRAYKWEMSGEGFAGIGIGDVVAMANGITGEGVGFSPVALSANRRTVTPSVEVEAASGFAWVWLLDNAVLSTEFARQADGTVRLNDAIPTPTTEDVLLDYRIALFPAGEPYRHVRITAIEPVDTDRFRFTARDEVAAYYDARTSDLTHELIDPRAAALFDATPLEGFNVSIVELGIRRFSWVPRSGATGYEIRYGASGVAFSAMSRVHRGSLTTSPYETEDLPPTGDYDVGIVAFGPRNGRTAPAYLRGVTFPDEFVPMGLDFRGVWADDETYNRNDLVRHNGSIWISLIDGNENIEPGTDANAWLLYSEDGQGRELIFARTAQPNAPSAPNNSWTFDNPEAPWFNAIPEATEAFPYIWMCMRDIQGRDSIKSLWTSARIVFRYGVDGQDGLAGVEGADGTDGQGKEWIFARTASTTAPSSPLNTWAFDSPVSPWFDAAPNLSATFPYLWRCERQITGASTVAGSWTVPVIVAHFGVDGDDPTAEQIRAAVGTVPDEWVSAVRFSNVTTKNRTLEIAGASTDYTFWIDHDGEVQDLPGGETGEKRMQINYGVMRVEYSTCFAPWQPVLLASGAYCPAGEMPIGEMVATPDGPREVVALSGIYATWERLEVYSRLTLDNGQEVICTPNHGFRLAGGGWASVESRQSKVDRRWTPMVSSDGRREIWSRGTQPQRSKIEPGTFLLGIDGAPVRVMSIEKFKHRVRVGELRNATPVTGSYCVVGGVVAAGCWSAETYNLGTADEVRAAYRRKK